MLTSIDWLIDWLIDWVYMWYGLLLLIACYFSLAIIDPRLMTTGITIIALAGIFFGLSLLLMTVVLIVLCRGKWWWTNCLYEVGVYQQGFNYCPLLQTSKNAPEIATEVQVNLLKCFRGHTSRPPEFSKQLRSSPFPLQAETSVWAVMI